MIITISGTNGSGKSTVAKLLCQKLGYNHYSVGDLRRKMALEKGMSINELNKLGEKEAFTDEEADKYQAELGKKEDNFIIDGRLSFHFIPHSIKFFLDADLDVRTKRIFGDKRDSEKYANIEEAKKDIVNREKSDTFRYMKYYNIDCYDRKHYDYVIDTTIDTPKQIVEKMHEIIERHGRN